MTTAAAAIPANGRTPGPPLTVAEHCAEILSALDPPKLTDMRRRCAEALKFAGAPDKWVEMVLAVPLEAPATRGSAE